MSHNNRDTNCRVQEFEMKLLMRKSSEIVVMEIRMFKNPSHAYEQPPIHLGWCSALILLDSRNPQRRKSFIGQFRVSQVVMAAWHVCISNSVPKGCGKFWRTFQNDQDKCGQSKSLFSRLTARIEQLLTWRCSAANPLAWTNCSLETPIVLMPGQCRGSQACSLPVLRIHFLCFFDQHVEPEQVRRVFGQTPI